MYGVELLSKIKMSFQVLTLFVVIVYSCTTQGFNESVVQYNELPDNIVNGTVIENILLIMRTESPLNYVSRQSNVPKISDSEKGRKINAIPVLKITCLKMIKKKNSLSGSAFARNLENLEIYNFVTTKKKVAPKNLLHNLHIQSSTITERTLLFNLYSTLVCCL